MKRSYEQVHFERIFKVFNITSLCSTVIAAFTLLGSSLKANIPNLDNQFAIVLQVFSIINFVNCVIWLFSSIVILVNVKELKKFKLIDSVKRTRGYLCMCVPLILLASVGQIIVLFLAGAFDPATSNIISTILPILIAFGFVFAQGVKNKVQ